MSDRSDNSEQGAASGGEEESPGILSDDQPPESPSDHEADEISKNFPWLRAVLGIINSFNYYCTHQNFCHPYCFKRHMRAATRLMKSVRKVRTFVIFWNTLCCLIVSVNFRVGWKNALVCYTEFHRKIMDFD